MRDVLHGYRLSIARALEEATPSDGPLAQLVRYPLGLSDAAGDPGPGIGGKLLRPCLTMLACEALGGDLRSAVPLATALELVHVFSLVHDDIQDGDTVRRGRPTTWRVLGSGQAINAGDALLVLALRTAQEGPLAIDLSTQAMRALLAATQNMIEGQVLDLDMQKDGGGTAAYMEMARLKTGALLGCALELGALSAACPEWASQHRRMGEELGLAFQIQDDMLGLWGDPATTGKPVGGDLDEGKRSYPLALAIEADPALDALLQEQPVPRKHMLERLDSMGIRDRCDKEAHERLNAALEYLAALPWKAASRQAFEELVGLLAAREA